MPVTLEDSGLVLSVPVAPSILVVDDDENIRQALVESLESDGYVVVQAESGAAALAIVVGDPGIHLIVTDVRMPGMSGIELVERALELRPELKVVLISGYFLPRQTALRMLRKPFHMSDLTSAIEAELSGTH